MKQPISWHPHWTITVALVWLVIALGAVGPQLGYGQLLQGTINGFVADSNQAAIPGAQVSVQNQSTNSTRDTLTDAQGNFSVVTLEPGTYTLTVKASGFQTRVEKGVQVKANEVTRLDVELLIGQVAQTITVSANAAILQTDRADLVSDLPAKSLTTLPLPPGRNYQQLIAVVVPGLASPTSGQSFGANGGRSIAMIANGVNADTNGARVDGTNSTNFNAPDKTMYMPALDDIENVNVVTNAYDAEQGVAGGMAVNITTKSGTNSIHGSLFEFHTDRDLQGYQWGANPALAKPEYINNQFGGAVGGPLRKNKLFYYVSYQGTYVNVGNELYATLPTAAMYNGDLSASPTPVFDPSTGDEADCLPGGTASLCGTGRTAFAGNKIPGSRIDSGVQALLSTYASILPKPNTTGTGSLGLTRNYLSQGVSNERQNQVDAKLNWNPTEKLSTFVRLGNNLISWANPQQFGALGGPGVSPANTAVGNGLGHIYSGTVSGTYIFSPNLIADAYFGYNRNNAQALPPGLSQNLGWTLMGIPGLQSADVKQGGLPGLYVDDFGGSGSNIPEAVFGPANNFQPQYYDNDEKDWAANVTWIKKSHNFRAGWDLDQQRDNEAFEQFTFCTYCTGAGGFEFGQGSTQLPGGPAGNNYNAWASFLLGLSSNAGKDDLIPTEYHMYQDIVGLYARDRWQVSHKLSVSYGVRWDYFPFPTRGNRGMEYLNYTTNVMTICGVAPGVAKNCGITKDTSRFEPRVGITYRFNHDSTVMRAGYALTTDPYNIGGVTGNRQNYPDLNTSTLPSTNSYAWATTLRTGLPAPVVPIYSTGTLTVPLTTGVYTVDNNSYRRGYIHSYNLTVEQQLPGLLASVSYVGIRYIDSQNSGINENWGSIGTGSAGQVLYKLTGRTASTVGFGTYGTAKYDGLQATARHDLNHNFEITGSFAYNRALSYANNVAIPSYWRLNYGNTAGVSRYTVGIAFIATSPFGRNQHWMTSGAGAMILGDWRLETVTTLRTGTPFTATGASTTLNASGSTQFAQCPTKPQKLGSLHEWYNTSNFTEPTTGTFGNCGLGSLWGPALNVFDSALSRSFPMFHESSLEFRASMFNAPNNPHHSNPTSSLTSSSFMQALGIANTGRDGIDQRTTQLSLHLVF